MDIFDLTKKEAAAIAAFKRLEKIWPGSLWVFCGDSGSIAILKTAPDGTHVMNAEGCVDQDYIVAMIDIEADGGGW